MNPKRCHSHDLSSALASSTPALIALLATVAAITTAILAPTAARAQSLDVVLDGALGSGVLLGAGDDGTAVGHTPVYLELEAGFIFDGDRSIEYTLGAVAQLEDTPAVGFTPQIRLLRPFGEITGFASAGVPVFLFPFTRFGLEVGGGALYPIVPERFAIEAQLQIDAFFGGSDLPADTTVLMFNLGLGGRVWF